MFMTAPYTHPVGFGPPRTQPDVRQVPVRMNLEGRVRPSDDGASGGGAARGSGPPDTNAAGQPG